MNGPKRIIIEYEDGTHQEVPYAGLSEETKKELSIRGCPTVSEPEKVTNYLLIQWKDGWKEVAAVGGHIIDVLRYYTIERMEEVGRLCLDVTEGYPLLMQVRRLPKNVESVLFIGKEEPKTYRMDEKIAVREGGKVEHFFYDKTKDDFKAEDQSTSLVRYQAILDDLKRELKKGNIPLETLLGMDEEKRFQRYIEFARNLGLRGMERQREVYGFIQTLLEKLAH